MSETFKTIPNPYIVGNPIKNAEMFYGRQDEFEFAKGKIQSGDKSYVIVYCGERRSGKTSILFQILMGKLGDKFLSVLIDMQTMAGLNDDNDFFAEIAQEICRTLKDPRLNMGDYDFKKPAESPYKSFKALLDKILALYPDKHLVLLIDEYEMMEEKFEDGSLNKDVVTYLAGLLESERRISFIFTGSRNLEQRKKIEYWRVLFGKSLYRRISFLSHADSVRLITEPVKGLVTFAEGTVEAIYRLTAGQPFYTQVVCQNLIDHLNEHRKTRVETADVEAVAAGIVQNPLPQMIYIWDSLGDMEQLAMAVLAEFQHTTTRQSASKSNGFIPVAKLLKFIQQKDRGFPITTEDLQTALANLYERELVSKKDDTYRVRIEILGKWIRQEISFWKIIHDVKPKISAATGRTATRTRGSFMKPALLLSSLAVVAIVAVLALYRPFRNRIEEVTSAARVQEQKIIQPNPVAAEKSPPETASEKMPVPKVEAPEKETSSENAPNLEEQRLANEARDTLVEKRLAAQLAQADKYAREDFNQGLALEEAGNQERKLQNYPQATKHYQEAIGYFEKAGAFSAETAQAIKEAKNKIAQVQNEVMIIEAAKTTKLGEEEEAVANYSAALTHYKAAHKLYADRLEFIGAMNFVRIKGGPFTMGNEGGRSDEQPLHEVTVSDFQISRFEITTAQYAAFLNSEGLNKQRVAAWIDLGQPDCHIEQINDAFRARTGFETHPVVYVTWDGANAFCNWVGGRLPTEAEWEYACRAGNPSAYYFGNDKSQLQRYAWSVETGSNQRQPVGQKLANDFGLHDMLGNVWEWCADWYDAQYYSKPQRYGPKGPIQGDRRVLRGGAFNSNQEQSRSSTRSALLPFDRYNSVGFRVLREAK